MKVAAGKSSILWTGMDQIAAAIGDLDSDDAVYILEDLDKEDREEILAQLPFTERVRLRRALDYPESSAGRRMQTEFVAVPPFWTVGQTIDYMRAKSTPEEFEGYLRLSALKYLSRVGHKHGDHDAARAEEYKKARWFLDRLIRECDP